ncbi:MAG TPA: TIM barrel protein [Candidatus Nitrosotalea sp.]|nr:TIM barrel protein [Candidatus Nitrosotalea sp.]
MKVACASGSLHRAIESGDLTQLEFLDLCARELACDGVVLDVRHFPRSDDDYLAQVKKMATDRGLSVAALAAASFFSGSRDEMDVVLAQAEALGAPLVAAPLASETECAWTDQLERIGTATSLAKARNVTLALRNAPQTFAATTHDCKRVAKEADSAWLRFGPDPLRLDAASEPRALEPNTVLLWSDATLENDRSIAQMLDVFAEFRGHLVLDEASGNASRGLLAEAIARWRKAMLDRR